MVILQQITLAGGESNTMSDKRCCRLIPSAGTPSPDYFPYETISASIQAVDSLPLHPPRVPSKEKKSLFSWLFPSAKATTSFTIPKYVQGADLNIIQLSTSLQYQAVTGPPPLALFLRKYVQKIYQPAYADWDVLINCGATDAWAKICLMLLEPGDAILVEEWTYPGAENAFLPMDVEMIPLTLDGNGIIPEYMDKVLGDWDEGKRGKKRPKVLYTIPTGQNPTGSTMTAERKKQIYEICCKYGASGIKFLNANLGQTLSFARMSHIIASYVHGREICAHE